MSLIFQLRKYFKLQGAIFIITVEFIIEAYDLIKLIMAV